MLPMTLHGQNSVRKPTASVVGEVYTIFDYRLHGTLMGSFIQIKRDYEVILYADGDTLRTKTDESGRFYFSGVSAGQATLYIEPLNKKEEHPFSGVFELMPGENIVIVPWQSPVQPAGYSLQLTDQPIMTAEGDTWTYHYPSIMASGHVGNAPRDEDYLISKLMGTPGVEYNKRKKLLRISGDAIRRTYVNGAYIFALKPDAPE